MKTSVNKPDRYSDLMFTGPADLLAKALTARPGPPVYHYLYRWEQPHEHWPVPSHQGSLSVYDMLALRPWQLAAKLLGLAIGLDPFPSRDGVCHGDEMFLMFKAHALPVSTVRSEADR
jgi:hypothetical protein